MTAIDAPISQVTQVHKPDTLLSRVLQSKRVLVGGGILSCIMIVCVMTLVATLNQNSSWYYDNQKLEQKETSGDGTLLGFFGYDKLGRSILARCLLGGTISLSVGLAAATIAVVLGVSVGLMAGYMGGWVDSVLMRFVDIMYGLPYILLVILFKVGFENHFINGNWLPIAILLLLTAIALALTVTASQLEKPLLPFVGILLVSIFIAFGLGEGHSGIAEHGKMTPSSASLVVMFLAIGLVSWLTLSRVIRGQVLSLRSMPFIESCRAMGMKKRRIFLRHVLPNLIGPITVYATLTVPSAILQESFLSFLGVGVQAPLPTWGSLAKDGVEALQPVRIYWWMLLYPCLLLMITLLSLNFMGDGLRDVFDPKREAAKI
jgi:ABC-type dipeptide/oligopeptide/nickel transport system permease subunit